MRSSFMKIESFLGLAPFDWESDHRVKKNERFYLEPMKPETREQLDAFYQKPNQELHKLIGRELNW